LPSLQKLPAAGMPLSINYWSPVKDGESKRLWVMGIMEMEVQQKDFKTGLMLPETAMMESVVFIEETGNGMKVRGYTSAKMLVSYVRAAIVRGEIVPGSTLTPVQITYIGKKLMKNGNSASDWQILPLIIT
jgi:hypothetical protein